MAGDSKSFQSNIQLLFEELELAVQWERPSILLAVCKSSITQTKAKAALEGQVSKLGQAVQSIEVDSENADIPRRMLESANPASTVFFVSNLDKGGGENGKAAYRTLNMHREFFVDQRVKAVFWLTPAESASLPKHAPDFWAFRHRAIEFAGPRGSSRKSLPAGALVWRLRSAEQVPAEIRRTIEAQEQLLAGLPATPESSAQRIELYEILAILHWKLGESAQALDALSRGLALAGSQQLTQARGWLLNGVGIISFERTDFSKALEIYTEVLESNRQDGFLWMNLGVTLSALGKYREALFRSEQALRLTPLDSRLWTTAGHLHLYAGRLDEAIVHFRRARELAPEEDPPRAGIAICFGLMGLAEDALQELGLEEPDGTAVPPYLLATKQAILGDGQGALDMLKRMIANGECSAAELRRDPSLAAALSPSQISALS